MTNVLIKLKRNLNLNPLTNVTTKMIKLTMGFTMTTKMITMTMDLATTMITAITMTTITMTMITINGMIEDHSV